MAVGTMMLFARVFDGVTDLIMGMIVDKTKSKYGKARPWLLWTAPFMMIGLVLLFSAPTSLSDSGKLVYAYLTYIFMNCIVSTSSNLPFNALLARMTLNVQDRTSASSINNVMTALTTLIVNVITIRLVMTMGWTMTCVVYGIIIIILQVLCFRSCRERVDGSDNGEAKVESVPFKVAFPALLKNKYFYLLTAGFLVFYIMGACVGSMTYYFCNIVLGNAELVGLVSTAQTGLSMLGCMVTPALVKRWGKQKAMIFGSSLMIVGGVLTGMAGTNLTLVVIATAIKGFGMGPIIAGIFAMVADVVDYGEWKQGIRIEGLVSSSTSIGLKIGLGLGAVLCTFLLNMGGYDGTAAAQSASAITSIRFGFGYFGAILSGVLLLIIVALNLDKYIGQIQEDLEAKRS